jgi:hypothetical protein
MPKSFLFTLACLLFLSWGCNENTPANTQAPAAGTTTGTEAGIDEESTRVVLERHWQTFRENDMEGVMADYSEESVLITPDATYRGLAEIRRNFENAFAAFPRDQTTFHLDKSVTDRDVAYILWRADTPAFRLTYATDTFLIRGGKIIRQTYAGVAEPVGQ